MYRHCASHFFFSFQLYCQPLSRKVYNSHKDFWTQNLHSDTLTLRFLTIIRWSSFIKYLQIRNMKAENLLWGWFFQFLCCSIFIFFEDFLFLLHKELNFSVFSDKILFGVVSCRMRFHTSWQEKTSSFNFWYFWCHILLHLES